MGFEKTYLCHDSLIFSMHDLLDTDNDSDCDFNFARDQHPDSYMNLVSVKILNNTKMRVNEKKTKRYFLTDCGYSFVAYALLEKFTAVKKSEASVLPLYVLISQAAALGCKPYSTTTFYPIHVTVYANINHLGHISSFSSSSSENTEKGWHT